MFVDGEFVEEEERRDREEDLVFEGVLGVRRIEVVSNRRVELGVDLIVCMEEIERERR